MQEAVLSSKIEGTQVTMGEGLEVEADGDMADMTVEKRADIEQGLGVSALSGVPHCRATAGGSTSELPVPRRGVWAMELKAVCGWLAREPQMLPRHAVDLAWNRLESLRDDLWFRAPVEVVHQVAQVGEGDEGRLLEVEAFDSIRCGAGPGACHVDIESGRIGYRDLAHDTAQGRVRAIARRKRPAARVRSRLSGTWAGSASKRLARSSVVTHDTH